MASGVFFFLLTMSDNETIDLATRLGRVEGKLDTLISRLDAMESKADQKQLDKALDRIEKLEGWRIKTMAWLAGCTATISILTLVAYNLLSLLKK